MRHAPRRAAGRLGDRGSRRARGPLDYPALLAEHHARRPRGAGPGTGVPQAAEVTAAVVEPWPSGVPPDGISVLRTEIDVDAGAENPCRLLRGLVGERVKLLTHDAVNRRELAYLAAGGSGEPIY